MRKYKPRFVNLEEQDYWTVKRAAEEKGLGLKGFLAALRLIIREWEAAQSPRIPSGPDRLTSKSEPEA
jgi:hypothetical protein